MWQQEKRKGKEGKKGPLGIPDQTARLAQLRPLGFPWLAKSQSHFSQHSTKEFLDNKAFCRPGKGVFQKRGRVSECWGSTSDPAKGPSLEECARQNLGLGQESRAGLSL